MDSNIIAKKMIFAMCILLLLIIIASVAYYRSLDFLPFAIGALLTTALNILKVSMLLRVVDNALIMEPKSSANYIRGQYLLRFVLTGAVFVLAALSPYISLWGAIAGIFTLPVAGYSMKFVIGKDAK